MTKIHFLLLLSVTLIFQPDLSAQKKTADTTFILRDTSNGVYHAVFIEKNIRSHYYQQLTNFKLDFRDSPSYKESIDDLRKNKIKISKIKTDRALPLNWCALFDYKGKFYLYSPSDNGNNLNKMITDSTIIEFFMDGPYASAIQSFKAIDLNTFEYTIKGTYSTVEKITIHVLDWVSEVAVFDNHNSDDNYRYTLMVGADRARKFPIVVNYCETQKQMEFNFDSPDFKEIMAAKKY